MTKAAVKAMDAVQEFTATLKRVPRIDDFVVAGASKRGWTTWTTGAVDKRCRAIVPMVMPILDIVPNINHHFEAYGAWSFAFSDYLDQGLMYYLNKPEFHALEAIVDPWSYRHRLTMPKLIMCSCGDEFFLPDSPRFFMDGLPGEKNLLMIPNAEHSLSTALLEVGTAINSFYWMVTREVQRPKYHYKLHYSNVTAAIQLWVDQTPTIAKMWYAQTLEGEERDFRLVVCDQIPQCINPVIWYEEVIQPVQFGYYEVQVNAPVTGWMGFLIELTFEYDLEMRFVITSEVNIVPDRMPFPQCNTTGYHCQTTPTKKQQPNFF